MKNLIRVACFFLFLFSVDSSAYAGVLPHSSPPLFPSAETPPQPYGEWVNLLLAGGKTPATPSSTLLVQVLEATIAALKPGKPLAEVRIPRRERLLVMGDIHGVWPDLIYGAGQFARETTRVPTHLLFLGDYLDRGPYSVEVMTLLLALKLAYPARVTLVRGNHETPDVNGRFGFKEEVLRKYGSEGSALYNLFNQALEQLPILVRVTAGKHRYAMMHGGIGPGLDLAQLAKERSPGLYAQTVMDDILWNDPSETASEFGPNEERGGNTKVFGFKQVEEFCQHNKVRGIVRAHQYFPEGYKFLNDRLPRQGAFLLTVHGASYGGKTHRFGAAALVVPENDLEVLRYELP
jgi:diadenosine tetraphosphatase ApaH/serine/threonine PP2A family protein phosphatase